MKRFLAAIFALSVAACAHNVAKPPSPQGKRMPINSSTAVQPSAAANQFNRGNTP